MSFLIPSPPSERHVILSSNFFYYSRSRSGTGDLAFCFRSYGAKSRNDSNDAPPRCP